MSVNSAGSQAIRLAALLVAAACAPTQTVVGRAPENLTRETPRETSSQAQQRKDLYTRRLNEADAGSARVVDVEAEKLRVGTAATRRFHRTSCRLLEGVPTSEQVRFTSSYDGLDNGYRPCETCEPMR